MYRFAELKRSRTTPQIERKQKQQRTISTKNFKTVQVHSSVGHWKPFVFCLQINSRIRGIPSTYLLVVTS